MQAITYELPYFCPATCMNTQTLQQAHHSVVILACRLMC